MKHQAVLYAAKSSEDRKGSIADQLADGRQKAAEEGWEIVGEYHDEGVSGWSRNRGPGLKAALQAAEAHAPCNLIVQHSDRLARGDGKQAVHLVERALWALKHEVTIVSIQDPQTFGDLLYAVVTGQRNHEDSQRKSRAVRDGKRRQRDQGRWHGGHTPYGFRLGDDAVLEEHSAEAAVVRRVHHEFADGKGQRAIARGLTADGLRRRGGQPWTQAAVRKILTNPVYIGFIRHDGELLPGAHRPLIHRELWDSVQALLAARAPQRVGRHPTGRHLFMNGLLRCAHCGWAMSPRREGPAHESYRCRGRLENGVEFCPMTPVPREVVDQAAFDYFQRVGLDVDRAQRDLEAQLRARRNEARVLLDDAQQERRRVEEGLGRLDADYLEGRLTAEEWRDLKASAHDRAERLRSHERALEGRLAALDGVDLAHQAREEILTRVEALRAAVAGDVHDAEGLDNVRAQLQRLFERFDIGRTDLPPDPDLPPALAAARAEALQELQADELAVGRWVIIPWPRPETVAPDVYWRPAISSPLESSSRVADNDASALAEESFSWPPFVAGTEGEV